MTHRALAALACRPEVHLDALRGSAGEPVPCVSRLPPPQPCRRRSCTHRTALLGPFPLLMGLQLERSRVSPPEGGGECGTPATAVGMGLRLAPTHPLRSVPCGHAAVRTLPLFPLCPGHGCGLSGCVRFLFAAKMTPGRKDELEGVSLKRWGSLSVPLTPDGPQTLPGNWCRPSMCEQLLGESSTGGGRPRHHRRPSQVAHPPPPRVLGVHQRSQVQQCLGSRTLTSPQRHPATAGCSPVSVSDSAQWESGLPCRAVLGRGSVPGS